MESILVLTHVDEAGSTLTKASLEAVAAGLELSRQTAVAAYHRHRRRKCRSRCNAVAATAARILTVSGEAFAQARYATDAAACEALCRAAGSHHRPRSGQCPLCTSRSWRGSPSWRIHRHSHHRPLNLGATRSHPLVLSPAHRSSNQPRCAAVVSAARRRHSRTVRSRDLAWHRSNQLPSLFRPFDTTVEGFRSPMRGRANHPPRRAASLRRRRRLDQETARRPDPRRRRRRTDPLASFVSQTPPWEAANRWWTKKEGGSGDDQPVLPFLTHLNQIGQTGCNAAPCQGPLYLLSWRRTPRCRLAFHRRTPRHQSRRKLRLDAWQGRRRLRRRCVSGDIEGQRLASGPQPSPLIATRY